MGPNAKYLPIIIKETSETLEDAHIWRKYTEREHFYHHSLSSFNKSKQCNLP